MTTIHRKFLRYAYTIEKYNDLARELKKRENMKVIAKSLIINVIGIMPKALGASLEKLEILRKIETDQEKAVQVVGKYNEDETGDLTRFGVAGIHRQQTRHLVRVCKRITLIMTTEPLLGQKIWIHTFPQWYLRERECNEHSRDLNPVCLPYFQSR